MAQEEFLDDPMPDIIEQWRYYFSVLAPQPDDQILDVGCNTAEAERLLLREYHNIGKVIGLEKDPKRYDYALSKLQKDGNPAQIELKLGDALDLPFPDSHFDRAFSVDVLEWVKEPVKALQEIHRVLKPSGTATIVHSDFDTQVFSCDDKELCRQIVHAFTDSGPNGQLGRELYRLCSLAGFHSVRPMIYPLINTEWLPNLYGYKAVQTMIEWFAKTGRVAESDLSRWLADIETQHKRNSFFYSINRNICMCVK
jgi:ubiquinone/menaquinone biosynthesis C-methylase UbiE